MSLKVTDQDTASVVLCSVDIRVRRDADPIETYTVPSILYSSIVWNWSYFMESELKRKGNRQQEQQHLCKQLNSFITLIHYYLNWM